VPCRSNPPTGTPATINPAGNNERTRLKVTSRIATRIIETSKNPSEKKRKTEKVLRVLTHTPLELPVLAFQPVNIPQFGRRIFEEVDAVRL
jgi:hypothetical protein